MGCDYKVYVGPYLEIRTDNVISIIEMQTCGSKSCLLHGKEAKSNFCPHCGTKIAHIETPCLKKVKFDPVEELNDTLTEVVDYAGGIKENFMILIPSYPNLGKHLDAKNDIDVLSYNENSVISEANIFSLKFQTEIGKCNTVFGTPNVTVRWGVIVWQI